MSKNNENVNEMENTEEVENNTNKVKTTTKDEKKVKIRIPIDPLNPKEKDVVVGINEKYAKVVRGEETEVSIPVYEVLKNAGLV